MTLSRALALITFLVAVPLIGCGYDVDPGAFGMLPDAGVGVTGGSTGYNPGTGGSTGYVPTPPGGTYTNTPGIGTPGPMGTPGPSTQAAPTYGKRSWVYDGMRGGLWTICANPAYMDDHPDAELMVWQGPIRNLVSGPRVGLSPFGYCWNGLPMGLYRVWYRYPGDGRNGAKYGSKDIRGDLTPEALQYLWCGYDGCGKGPNQTDVSPCGCDGMFEVLSNGQVIPRGNTSPNPAQAIQPYSLQASIDEGMSIDLSSYWSRVDFDSITLPPVGENACWSGYLGDLVVIE